MDHDHAREENKSNKIRRQNAEDSTPQLDFRLARVFDANVRCKFLIALRFKVPHHCVKILSGRRTGRVEDPCALGTAPTTKARLVYPHQLAQHRSITPFEAAKGRTIFGVSTLSQVLGRFPQWEINIDQSQIRE